MYDVNCFLKNDDDNGGGSDGGNDDDDDDMPLFQRCDYDEDEYRSN